MEENQELINRTTETETCYTVKAVPQFYGERINCSIASVEEKKRNSEVSINLSQGESEDWSPQAQARKKPWCVSH